MQGLRVEVDGPVPQYASAPHDTAVRSAAVWFRLVAEAGTTYEVAVDLGTLTDSELSLHIDPANLADIMYQRVGAGFCRGAGDDQVVNGRVSIGLPTEGDCAMACDTLAGCAGYAYGNQRKTCTLYGEGVERNTAIISVDGEPLRGVASLLGYTAGCAGYAYGSQRAKCNLYGEVTREPLRGMATFLGYILVFNMNHKFKGAIRL